MTAAISVKRGDTFSLSGQLLVNNSPIDISGYSIRSHLRDRAGNLIAELVVSVTTFSYTMYSSHTDTANWPVGVLNMDIEFTDTAGRVTSSETLRVTVLKDETV